MCKASSKERIVENFSALERALKDDDNEEEASSMLKLLDKITTRKKFCWDSAIVR